MTNSDYELLRNVIAQDEGLRLTPYQDTQGKWTIGYGHNLSDRGISQAVADLLREEDLQVAQADLFKNFPVVLTLNAARQIVLISMCFNLGILRLGRFAKMWTAIEAGNFSQAAIEMLDSTWASQVGARAMRLAETMHSGELNKTYIPLWAKEQAGP